MTNRTLAVGSPVAVAGPRVGEVGEHALLDRIRRRVPPPPDDVLVGIGDDAAVVKPARNELAVITTDSLVEGVHFDLDLVTAADLGFKALAVNLSDLAAMGAAPRVALLSLALPAALPLADVEALLDGLLELAGRFGVALVGGNLTRSTGPLVVDVTAVGSVRPRRVLQRRGARAGDELYVSGTLGRAAAGLGLLRSRRDGAASSDDGECERQYRRPEPRVRLGILLARNKVPRAAIDLSDGLGDGVRQLAGSNALGAVIDADALPVAPCARAWFDARGVDPVRAAIAGGEDYELLIAVPPRARNALRAVGRLVREAPLTRIGVLTAERRLVLRQDGRDHDLPAGFAHFG